jgi:MFS transporter, FHS family, L-fucose permease
MAVIAQFLYVAAQADIFSFFINYMTSQTPEIPATLDAAVQHSPGFLKNWLNSLTEIRTTGAIAFNNKGGSNLVSVGLLLFLGGRLIGTALLKTILRPQTSWSL